MSVTAVPAGHERRPRRPGEDRKSTRLNSSHDQISYAAFCLKKKNDKSAIQTNNNNTNAKNKQDFIPAGKLKLTSAFTADYASQAANGFRLIFFFNDTATTEIYTLSLHDALPI